MGAVLTGYMVRGPVDLDTRQREQVVADCAASAVDFIVNNGEEDGVEHELELMGVSVDDTPESIRSHVAHCFDRFVALWQGQNGFRHSFERVFPDAPPSACKILFAGETSSGDPPESEEALALQYAVHLGIAGALGVD